MNSDIFQKCLFLIDINPPSLTSFITFSFEQLEIWKWGYRSALSIEYFNSNLILENGSYIFVTRLNIFKREIFSSINRQRNEKKFKDDVYEIYHSRQILPRVPAKINSTSLTYRKWNSIVKQVLDVAIRIWTFEKKITKCKEVTDSNVKYYIFACYTPSIVIQRE